MGSKLRYGWPPAMIGVCMVAAMFVAGADTDSAESAPAPAVNPHFSAEGCATCHTMTDGKARPIARNAIDQQCLDCHDGLRAVADAHPIDRTFESEQVHLPEGWPTNDGRLGCITCHDIRGACDHTSGRPGKNPMFLRHDPGPDVLSFCGQCHEAATGKQVRYNPHIMLDDQGKVVPKSCEFCHRDTAGLLERQTRLNRPALRTNAITMCVACHSRHVDYFEPGHVGQTAQAEMLARLAVGHDGSTTRPALPTSQPASLRLPLDRNNRVVCSTCHNPHQAGVFPTGSALAAGATRPGSPESRLQLRGLSKGVCRACHHR